MLVGSIIYALAGLANTWSLLLVGRVVGGLGGSAYPVMTYLSEAVGKKHRSNVTSMVIGVSRSLGYALGPVFAAALVHVDFHMGELTIDKRNNPGFFVALLCVGQLVSHPLSFSLFSLLSLSVCLFFCLSLLTRIADLFFLLLVGWCELELSQGRFQADGQEEDE